MPVAFRGCGPGRGRNLMKLVGGAAIALLAAAALFFVLR